MRRWEGEIKAFLFVLLSVLAGLISHPAAGATETAPAATDAVGLIEAHYRDLADLSATVVQKNYLKTIDKTQTFEGTLRIKRPGKLRLEYTNGQVIVIDGSEAWFYSKKSEQAIRRTFRDFEQANIPVAFLLGAAHIRDDFEVVEEAGGKARRTLDLTPKRPHAAMTRIGLVCDDTGRITAMMVHDRSGNISTIAFSDTRENTGLEDGLFRFKVPKGTEVIEQ
jgi:outer membrane lipoprotein carrier protein